MSSFLEIALAHADLGLHVFPVARDKGTLTEHGFKDATVNPDKIRAWWAKTPSANPGFAPGASDVAVLDVDYGLSDMASFIAWRDRNNIPATYTVRSGSRPEFKVHMYFKGAMRDVGTWELDGCSGQVKSLGGYVLAAGSEALHGEKHDKPGAPYEVIDGTLGIFAPTPDVVRQLRKPVSTPTNTSKVPKTAWSLPVHSGENRTGFLLEQTGVLRNLGCGKDAILARMYELNGDPEIIADPVDEERLESTAINCAKFPVPSPEPKLIMGKPAAPVDWRAKYHNFQEVNEAPEPTFLIEGFLQEDVVTALAAPVGQRKSIIALNVIHACCTGDSLFGHFTVTKKPDRVLYLVPEMGLLAVAKRLRLIGLIPHVGKTLFIRTMNSEGRLFLKDLTPEEVRGALVVLDTAARFIEGDENSSEHMKQFSEECFSLMKAKPAAALVLYHSGKETKTASELSLENALRGSGELGAAVSSCWATRLQDPDPSAAWTTASFITNVKMRDFESKPFEATSGPDYRMHFVTGSEGAKIVLRTTGPRADADGKQAEADAVIRQNIGMSGAALVVELGKLGIVRGRAWACERKKALISQDYAQMQKVVKSLRKART